MEIRFSQLFTKRLNLRMLKQEDEEAIYKLRTDDEVNKYLDRPRQKSLDDANRFIRKINYGIMGNEWYYWAVTNKESDEFYGTICLWNFSKDKLTAEIGYELLPEHFGKGIMQEAIPTILKFGFEKLNLNRIEAYTHKNNLASIKLLKKFHFKLISEEKPGQNKNEIIYYLNPD